MFFTVLGYMTCWVGWVCLAGVFITGLKYEGDFTGGLLLFAIILSLAIYCLFIFAPFTVMI